MGGGEIYIQNALSYLVKKGYECVCVCFYDGVTNKKFTDNNDFVIDGIKVAQRTENTEHGVKKIYEEFDPDIVITQSTDSLMYLTVAKTMWIPTIFGLHFYNEILSIKNGTWYRDVLTKPENFNIELERQQVFHMTDKFFVNSDYMLEVVRKYVKKEPDAVIYPPFDESKIKISNHYPEYITYINPNVGKGMGVFFNLALYMPQYKFRIVGPLIDLSISNVKIYKHLQRMRNVDVIGFVSNMRDIYRDTKLLLVPSLVDETFSMVTIESLFNGIPVLTSNNGNPPYIIKNGGGYAIDAENIDEWKRKVSLICENKDEYRRLQEEGRENVKKYDPEKQNQKLIKLVEDLM